MQAAKKTPVDKAAVVKKALAEIRTSGVLERSLKLGQRAPIFSLPDASGRTVSSAELLDRGPVVLAFYRGHWCPYCNAELDALQKALPQIRAAGASLVAISPEKPDFTLISRDELKLAFEVLSDVGNRVARQFGLVFTLPKALVQMYRGFGIDLLKFDGDGSQELPVPATFVLDRDGTVKFAFVDPDYTRRADPIDILSELKKLQSQLSRPKPSQAH